MRRQIGDLIRSIANYVDPPKPLVLVIHIRPTFKADARAVADAVNQHIQKGKL